MNQPWIYMCSPSQSPLPPPSPPDPSGSSQCTRPEHLSHASNHGICFIIVTDKLENLELNLHYARATRKCKEKILEKYLAMIHSKEPECSQQISCCFNHTLCYFRLKTIVLKNNGLHYCIAQVTLLSCMIP